MQADIAKVMADGQASAKKALADAELYAQEKQAQALKAKLTAQARSLHYPSCTAVHLGS